MEEDISPAPTARFIGISSRQGAKGAKKKLVSAGILAGC